MYKLMLVDDEAMIRHQVLSGISWQEYGFQIVCEAENGREAYDLFERHQPDVVITDIRMPIMDGLELADKILKKYPYTKIIILTGFDDFDYAKKGIELQVMHYLLKPISRGELTDILIKTKKTLDEEIANKKNLEKLKAYYQQSFPLMRSKFLEELLNGNYRESELKEEVAYYQLKLAGQLFAVCYIKNDVDLAVEKKDQVEVLNLQQVALLRFMDSVKDEFGLGEYFLGRNAVFLIESFVKDDEQAFLERLEAISDNIIQGAKKYLDVDVTIGVGGIVHQLTELEHSKEMALTAYDYKMLQGSGQAIFIHNIEKKTKRSLNLDNAGVRRINRILRTGQFDEYQIFLEDLFCKLIKNDKNSENMSYLLQLYSVVDRISEEMAFNDFAVEGIKEQLLLRIANQESLEEIKRGLLILGEKLIHLSSEYRRDTTRDLIYKAKEIIADKYQEADLSLEYIASALHYSPNYLSSVFKKETDESLNTYIIRLRIEAAKELLTNSAMKSTEIAMNTGFSSSSYFAFSFKKLEGLSPREYRKKYRSGGQEKS